MRAPANQHFIREEARAWAQSVEWKKLEVLLTKADATRGFVEFMAFYYHEHKRSILHEISEFHFEDGQWFYVNGEAPNVKAQAARANLVGRNDTCSCGSEKKFKKCCGKFT